MNYKEVGQRISYERQRYNLTREQFAELVELSVTFVGQIERGEKKMGLDSLIRISESLHVSLDYLIKGHRQQTCSKNKDELYALIKRCTEKEVTYFTKMIKLALPYLRGGA